MKNICVDTALMQQVTGHSLKSCQRYLKQMKDFYGKGKHQFITLQEYADYSGIPLELLERARR